MAEHYGVVPKRFTKEWWPYFWMYYKWHTIGIAAALVLIVFTVHQCAVQPQYDFMVTYAGHQFFAQEQTDSLVADWNSRIGDVDGNGESSVFFQTLSYTDTSGSEEYDTALDSKLDMSMYDEGSYIYIVDSKRLMRMLNNSYRDDVYAHTYDWTDADESRLYMVDGEPYAVSLADSSYFKDNGYISDDMYLLMKRNYKEGELEQAAYNESVKLAQFLVK